MDRVRGYPQCQASSGGLGPCPPVDERGPPEI